MEISLIDQLELTEIYGYIAALLTTLAFLPQLLKTLKTQSANDVSLIMLIMFMTGLVFWIIYGWKANAIPVLIANIITLILNSSILILKLKYKN
tara:strand:+ start:30 stop:311 length:282 start_codon:yes stop_codon:yes gene_type:complete